MSEAGKITPTYIEIPPELKRRAKAAASLRGIQFREAVVEALEKWLTTSNQHSPDLSHNPAAIASSGHGNPAEVARRAARVVALLDEAKTLVEQVAEADSSGQTGGGKHTPRKRAGG